MHTTTVMLLSATSPKRLGVRDPRGNGRRNKIIIFYIETFQVLHNITTIVVHSNLGTNDNIIIIPSVRMIGYVFYSIFLHFCTKK